jgi:hypothetical protein
MASPDADAVAPVVAFRVGGAAPVQQLESYNLVLAS